MTESASPSRSREAAELIAIIERHGQLFPRGNVAVLGDKTVEMLSVGMTTKQWAVVIEALRAFTQSETRAFEKEPFAWAVKLASGVESLVYHPIEGALDLQPGDVAYPLFREVYTQAQLDAADAEAKRLVGGLKVE